MIDVLTDDNEYSRLGDEWLNHVICGDFNPTSWKEDFEIWTGEKGLWELTDPTVPT